MYRLLMCCLLFLVGVPGASSIAQSRLPNPKPLEYSEHTLPNGLRLVVHEDRSTPVVNLQVWYHVGSKDEKTGRTGFAHLFEHLMFKGSANVKPEEHDEIITKAGGSSNAYTTDDVTVYWQTFPANLLETVLWLEADRMRSLDVSEANFQSERDVVKEERLTRIENPPYGDILEQLYREAFTVHPYRHVTIGSMEDLNKATLADVGDFFKTYYVPGNATLVIAGDVASDKVIALVEKYFGSIPKGSGEIPRSSTVEPDQTRERRVERTKAVPLPAYVAGYRVPADGHPDSYALTMLSSILSEGRSSRIYRSLVYEQQLAIEANAGGNFSEDPNLFFVFLIMSQGRTAKSGEDAIDREIERLVNSPVTDSELAKARTAVRSQYTFSRLTVQDKAAALGHAAVLHKDTRTVNTEFDLFMAVSKEDIQRVARKYLRPENRTVLTVTPTRVSQ